MWWFDRPTRRAALALGLCAAGAACGFAPAYGPQGGASRLSGQVVVSAPADRAGYLLGQRIEERLGFAATGPYTLTVTHDVSRSGLGTGGDGRTTRYQLVGSARYSLREGTDGPVLAKGTVDDFTGYSATGSTVATLAAVRDAEERLMVILADKVVDRLLMAAPDLPS
ncbi:LPS assembly lipoprotein LptE [Mesobacterium pallidum]|uniref:LPS assembly lipoprotein LptE n=1 Tax=Mesobacterium pallidum TaxID=2872037 RepID=UPI001EE2B7D0|nr:LPS assembly lipoprotein LptE [Mesobacterium pallidum]